MSDRKKALLERLEAFFGNDEAVEEEGLRFKVIGERFYVMGYRL